MWENVSNFTLCCDEGCVNRSFFLPRRNYLVEQTVSVWDCKPSHKPRPFPPESLIFSFCCTKSSLIFLTQSSRAESRGSASKATLLTRYQWTTGSPQHFSTAEVRGSLHFPCVTDDCVCELFLSQPIIFTFWASRSPLYPAGGLERRWVSCLYFGVFWCGH